MLRAASRFRALLIAGLSVAVLIAVGLTSASSDAAPAQPTSPSFVQQVSAHRGSTASLAVTPAATAATGPNTIWLLTTIVFRHA